MTIVQGTERVMAVKREVRLFYAWGMMKRFIEGETDKRISWKMQQHQQGQN